MSTLLLKKIEVLDQHTFFRIVLPVETVWGQAQGQLLSLKSDLP